MSVELLWIPAALAVLAVAVRRHVLGVIRLRQGLSRVAQGDLQMPLMLDLPRGLRSAERDLKAIALRIKELDRAAGAERLGLSAILASIPEGVFIVDRNMTIRLGNRGIDRMFALAVPPAGRTVMEVFRNVELHRVVREGVLAGQARGGEISIGDGRSHRVLELSVSPLVLDDAQRGAVVVVHDITKIKGLERVRREFVANVSHELRTPLTIIGGYLETLLDGGLEDRVMAEGALGVMHKHADRLKHLVDDLLTISQAESRNVPLDLHRLDLREVLRRVIEQFDEAIRAQAAAVRVTAPPGDLHFQGDPVKIEQVFVNLLENALKYGNREGLAVEFQAERAGNDLLVRVTDNGPGIPYEDQEHIFERFYRVHKHRSRDTGGTGLGLSIVKNIVAAHGGTVSLHSVPGAGSTFHLVLPVDPQQPAAAAAA